MYDVTKSEWFQTYGDREKALHCLECERDSSRLNAVYQKYLEHTPGDTLSFDEWYDRQRELIGVK